MPSARVDATAMVQKASLISNRSMSPSASPVRSGATPTEPHDTMRASGTRPWAAA
jgi:hypothetical protein